MASDITEEFQVDISNESTFTVPSVGSGSGMTYDVAFNTIGFFDATTPEQPYRRQTAPYRKEQQDNSIEPGEQSLTGWWLRSQSSFHFGAGAKFYEPAQDQNLRFKFENSEGLNVWTPGQVTLLKDVDIVPHPIAETNTATLRTISSGALLHDGLDIDKVFDTITRTITNVSLTSNVATYTTSAAHGFTAKMYVRITGIAAPNTVFNTEGTITGVTSTTFTVALTNANVSSTAVTGTASVGTIHFVDYAAGADPVYAVADDGTYAYWVTDIGSPKKWSLYRKPLTGDATSTADEVKLYEHTGEVSESAVMEYVKDRLVIAVDNTIYKADVQSSSSTVTPAVVYTHGNVGFRWTSITESPSDIYLSGYENNRSVIHRIYTDGTFTNGLPDLVTALVVAEFPRGEIVYSIKAYLGYMVIGTSKGVRVGQIQDDGSLVYGPLLFESEQPVYQIACSGRYAWVTNRIGTDTGLTRIDLGTQIEPLVFAYANDLQADGENKVCSGVAFIGNSNRIAFTSIGAGGKIFFENATRLRSSGFLRTGRIRFNTTEDKFFKYVKARADFPGGTITIGTTSATIITVDNTNGNSDIGIPESAAAEQKQFVFTLNRSSTDTTIAPTMFGYQIKALPAIRRQRLVQYNLFCFDNEEDKFNNRIGYQGRAFERINLFEDLEATSDIVTVQDFKTGETFQGLIEEVSFKGETAPHKYFSGFGGILTVTVRKL